MEEVADGGVTRFGSYSSPELLPGRRSPAVHERVDLGHQKNSQQGQGGARGHEEEDGQGLALRGLLTSPESRENGGSNCELRRAIPSAWGHERKGNERGIVEEREGYL